MPRPDLFGWLAMALMAVGCHGGPTDFVEGTWGGNLIDGDLNSGVELVDPATTFTISFYEGQTWEGPELWADIVIDGALNLYGVGLDGEEEDTVTDVHLADDRVLVKPMVGGITLKTRGVFSDDLEALDLDVRFIGDLYLLRIDDFDEAEDEPPDDGGGGGIG
jgi:hypothetical protein